MDRTVLLNDKMYIVNGGGLFRKKSFLPFESTAPFTVERKFICPKQVNDTVKIFFRGTSAPYRVFADKTLLTPEKDGDGNTVYDVTSALRTGKIRLKAYFRAGRVDGFYFDVKRDYGKTE